MTGTFKANIPYNTFLLFVYGLVLRLPSFIHPVIPVPQKDDAFFYKTVLNWIQPAGNSFPFIYSALVFLLLYFQAISLNKMVNSQRLLPKPNYLPGMSYLLLTAVFPGWYLLSAPLLVTSFLIWIVSKLCTLHNNPDPKTTLFNIGWMMGTATLFYFPSIAFVLLVLSGLAISRTFKLPEWITVFLGIATPYYLLWAWFFLNDKGQEELAPTFALSVPILPGSGWSYAAIILIIMASIVGIIFIQNSMRRLLVQSRKSWSILYLYLLIALIVPFLHAVPSFDYWILSMVPLAAIVGAAFLFPDRKWFPLVVHWSLVLLTGVLAYFYYVK